MKGEENPSNNPNRMGGGEGGRMDLESGRGSGESLKRTPSITMPNLPKPLTLEEKKFLLAVERGDSANVRKLLQRAHRRQNIHINCVDSLGRGAMSLAIDSENLEMLELLVVLGVETKDSLLHAINVGFVEAVELLLEHEELIHKEGEPYSWEKTDRNTATFTPDITPLILAAHRNNYEILKILLDRGATLPMPHDIKCSCDVCIRESEEDSLRYSISRVNQYRALASPSLIALSSSDPILTTFQLSWELRTLAFAEQESKAEYMELRRQCQKLGVDLLAQSRSSHELAIILNHDPESPPYEEGEHMKLARLELAIEYKQKKFVAHPNVQQLLAAIWYDGLPGFRRKPLYKKLIEIVTVALLFPYYCFLYMIAPSTPTGKLMRKPFMKFLIHASSYLFFLLLLILVSQRAEVLVIQLFGTESMRAALEDELLLQRGNGPTILECLVLIYVIGFIWEETTEIRMEGINKYLRNMWNFIDFTRNSLYVAVVMLRIAAYWQQNQEISQDPETAFIPREQWDDYDFQLIAEGLFAAANVFSALKLVHMFSINPHLGPLQISLGRMVIDIVKFFFIYSLVLFAFACGLNQLLWYFAELERRKCYSLPGGLPDWDNKGDSCTKWRSFGNLFESTQSLFWASFGGVGIDTFDLTGIKSYTRFWGLLMFGSYSVINVIVLLNLLIAMMSNSYAIIDEHSDTEWKFARTKLWMSYFEESSTLPPPFNTFPTPKHFLKLFGLRKKDKLRRMSTKRKEKQEKERDYRYTAVMRELVWRYVSAMHRQSDESPVTEDDVNEIKSEINSMRYELLDVLERNGLDVSSADKKEKTVLGKKNKVWERRLMKDFHLAPVAPEEEMDSLMVEPPPDEDVLSRFRRIAKLAVLSSTQQKWGQVIHKACKASQIGHCNSRESYKNQQNLQKAMQEAKKLVARSPKPESSFGSPTCIPLPETTGSSIIELLHDISEETKDLNDDVTNKSGTKKPPKGGRGVGLNKLLTTECRQKTSSGTKNEVSPYTLEGETLAISLNDVPIVSITPASLEVPSSKDAFSRSHSASSMQSSVGEKTQSGSTGVTKTSPAVTKVSASSPAKFLTPETSSTPGKVTFSGSSNQPPTSIKPESAPAVPITSMKATPSGVPPKSVTTMPSSLTSKTFQASVPCPPKKTPVAPATAGITSQDLTSGKPTPQTVSKLTTTGQVTTSTISIGQISEPDKPSPLTSSSVSTQLLSSTPASSLKSSISSPSKLPTKTSSNIKEETSVMSGTSTSTTTQLQRASTSVSSPGIVSESINSSNLPGSSFSSRESLIPKDSPVSNIQDVKAIKRQPKTGWL